VRRRVPQTTLAVGRMVIRIVHTRKRGGGGGGKTADMISTILTVFAAWSLASSPLYQEA